MERFVRMSSAERRTRLRACVGFAQETGVGIEEIGDCVDFERGRGVRNGACNASRWMKRSFRVLRRSRRVEGAAVDMVGKRVEK